MASDLNAIHPSHKMHSHTYQPAAGWWARSCRFCHAEERWTLGRSQVRTTEAIREPCKAAPTPVHLWLAHCSLRCEEKDGMPSEEAPAPVEGASDGRD